MTWSLASYTTRGGQGFGVLREDGALVRPAGLERWPDSMDLLEDWPAAEAVLRDLDVGNAPVIEYDALLPPLQWPRKVICAGVNYRKHMREMGAEIPEASLSSTSTRRGNTATWRPRSATSAGSGNATGFGLPSPG